MAEFLKPYLTGNARIINVNPGFATNLARFIADNPHGARISSLDRDIEQQKILWDRALVKYGSAERARKWVAPPGGSNHNKGVAADLKYNSPEATKWAHENAAKYGLRFPLSNENWHVEPIEARAGMALPAAANTGGTAAPDVGPAKMALPGMTLNSAAPAAPPADTKLDLTTKEGWAKALGDKDVLGSLEGIGKALQGGGQNQAADNAAAAAATINPTNIGAGVDAQLMTLRQQAAPIMAQVLKRRTPGMSLGFMG